MVYCLQLYVTSIVFQITKLKTLTFLYNYFKVKFLQLCLIQCNFDLPVICYLHNVDISFYYFSYAFSFFRRSDMK